MSLWLSLIGKTYTKFGYSGIYKIISLIIPQYYWLHVNKDIENYAKHYISAKLI